MIPKYDRDVKWPWGQYKNVPVSCIPLSYLAWFVQTCKDRIWMGLIEKELLCRKLGDKEMRSKTKFNTPDKVLDELAMNEFRQQRLKAWHADPRVGDWLKKPVVDSWYKTHGPGNKKLQDQRQAQQKVQNKTMAAKSKGKWRQQQDAKKITNNTKITSTTGSYTTPTHNFDGSPVDFSTAPF